MYKLARTLFVTSTLAWCYIAALVVVAEWPRSGWVLAIVTVLLLKRRRSVHLTTLGSARWASHEDLRDAGMLYSKTGLGVGHLLGAEPGRKGKAIRGLFRSGIGNKAACQELKAAFKKGERGPLVRLSQAIHTAVFCPSGGGKGVSFVIPFLLSCPESCVVIDFKGENALVTAKYREKTFGQRQVLLDLYRVVTQAPDSLNSLDFIDINDPEAIDEIRDLAQAMIVRTSEQKERHFDDSAEIYLAAIIAVVVFYGDAKSGTRSLQTVREIFSDPQKLEQAGKVLLASELCGGLLARMGGQLSNFIDRERASVLTTLSRHLRWLDTPAVVESTKHSSFDPALLRSGQLTVFLIIPPNHMVAQSPLLRTWITTLLRAVVKGGLNP